MPIQNKTQTVTSLKIVTDAEKPMPIEIIAESIKSVSDNFNLALKAGLTTHAIAVLIQDQMTTREKIGLGDIKLVLRYAASLKNHLTK